MGVFGGAESNGAISFFLKINISGRIDRFDNCERINSDRLFKFWSIFDETPDIEVFRGAESNDGVLFRLKSIFVVESIDHFTQSSFASTVAISATMTSSAVSGYRIRPVSFVVFYLS